MSNMTVVKLTFNDSLRRFEVPVNDFDSFYASIAKTLKLFTPFRLAYQDVEGDIVTFDSTQELNEALTQVNGVLRVQVLLDEQPLKPALLPAIPIQEKKQQQQQQPTKVEQQQPNKLDKKIAKQEKKAVKASMKGEKKALKLIAKADKLDAKLNQKQGKLLSKQTKVARQAQMESIRCALRAKNAQVAQACAQVKATREQVKSLGAQAPETLRTALQQQQAIHRQLKAQAQSKRAELQALRQANQAAKKNAVPTEDSQSLAADQELPQGLGQRLKLARECFATHGLNVVLVTPAKMAEVKAQGKGAFQKFRRDKTENGRVVLMPAFVKRLAGLQSVAQLETLIANKSKVLLSKGNGAVKGELAEQRALIDAKQAELVRVRTELRELRVNFKRSFGQQQVQEEESVVDDHSPPAAATDVVVGNTPIYC